MEVLHRGYVTHTGLVREANEDAFGYYPNASGALIVVADGMGGMGGGAVASRLTVQAMYDVFRKSKGGDPRAILRRAGSAADRVITKRALQAEELATMGATVAAAIVRGNMAYVAHAGDSRAYLIRPGECCQLTEDHSLARIAADGGLVAADKNIHHLLAHRVYRAIGHLGGDEIEVAPEPVKLHAGDALLLCSDGLTDLVDDHEIAETVNAHDPQTACDELLKLVLQRGAHDNTTIQVVRYRPKTAGRT
jgi:protein phosphatase